MRTLRRELDGIRQHHERFDSSGYPDGLRGEAIPLDARSIAVADVYDALTSHRAYRAARTPARALATIDPEAGQKFDPTGVAALHRVLQRIGVIEEPELAERGTYSGQFASTGD